MAIAVKAYATANWNNSVVIPASVSAGDLLILHASSYNSTVGSNLSGWTHINSGYASNAYVNTASVFWKIATSADAGASVTAPNMDNSYSGTILLVITGHDQANPIHKFSSGTSTTTSLTSGTLTTTLAPTRRFVFFSQMANTNTTPTFSVGGSNIQQVANVGLSAYYRFGAWMLDTVTNTGSQTEVTAGSSLAGAGLGMDVVVLEENSPPTVTVTYPLNNTAVDNSSPKTFTWTYSDPEGVPQAGYTIRYRERGVGSNWVSVSGTTATSHTFNANTFIDGKEYEWQIRVSDGAFGSWSSSMLFTAGKSTWDYGVEVASATSSGNSHLPLISHTFETTTEGWQANNFFGTYLDPTTIARTSTRAKTGTYALEVTFPALTKPEASRVITQDTYGFVVGARYTFEADVYVEAGGPDIRLDAFLQTGGTGPAHCLEKGVWRHLLISFIAVTPNIHFGVNTTSTAVAGKKIWIDNAIIKPAPLESGNYVLQVRTADAEGFGPWSANSTFAVNSPPTAGGIDLSPKRVGGNINITWNYLDINSNPQAKYQIKYRKK